MTPLVRVRSLMASFVMPLKRLAISMFAAALVVTFAFSWGDATHAQPTLESAGLALSATHSPGVFDGGATTVATTVGTFVVYGAFHIRDHQPLVLQTRKSGQRFLCDEPLLACAALL